MRILLWLSLGFAASCALGVWLLGTWVLIPGAVATVAVISVIALGKKIKFWKPVSAVLFGIVFGSITFSAYDTAVLLPLRQIDGTTQRLEIFVTDYSQQTEYGIRADGTVKLEGKTYAVRFYRYDQDMLEPGDRVVGQFRMRYTPPGGKSEATSHGGKGVFLLAYPNGEVKVIPGEKFPWQCFPAFIRNQVKKLLEQTLPTEGAAFMKALLIGDTSGLDYGVLTDLSVSGIRHVAAVSGLHVSILMTMVYLVIGRNRYVSLLVGAPLLLLFAAIAGFSPSVTRACVMQLLMLLSLVVNREYDPPTALAFSVLGMLIANPMVITNVGFQLSVGSVAGIFLFADKICGWLLQKKRLGAFLKGKRSNHWITGISMSIGISLGAMVLTVPLCAVYFGVVSLLSVVTNLLCLWLITFVFCGGLVVCGVGAIWLSAGKVLGWLLAWPVRYILLVAKTIASIPFSAVYMKSVYVVIWLAFCYILLAFLLLGKEKRAGLLTVCAVVGLVVSLLLSWLEPRLDPYRMTVLDVGQGQCILLQSGGKNYLVDCGSDWPENAADTAAHTLFSQGIYSLDGLILTHYDADHTAGAKLLAGRIPIKALFLPAADNRGIGAELAQLSGSPAVWVTEHTTIQWADGEITLFGGETKANSNESGLCVLFHTEKCDILITGDRAIEGELALLREYEIPKLDVLVVGHHGSDSSTSYALLRMTAPKVAVISVGADNRYGMPDPEVLKKLEEHAVAVFRTDLDGTILIRE